MELLPGKVGLFIGRPCSGAEVQVTASQLELQQHGQTIRSPHCWSPICAKLKSQGVGAISAFWPLLHTLIVCKQLVVVTARRAVYVLMEADLFTTDLHTHMPQTLRRSRC